MRSLDDDISDTILAVPVTAADTPMLGSPSPLRLGPSPPLPLDPPPHLPRPLLLWFVPPPPSPLPKKRKFTITTITKSCMVAINKMIKEVEK